MQRTHSNKPINPKRTIVANKPSTDASKPSPRQTVLPARDILPLTVVWEENGDVGVGLRDDRESKGVIKESVLVSTEGCETDDDGFNEAEVVGGDVAADEVESDPGIVVVGVPVCGDDDDMSQEHDSEGVLRDVVPDAQSSWNGGSIRGKCRRSDSELNLKRPSKSNMPKRVERVYRGV